jgi:dinuclear metal center YbgI/SA1388 family protein
MKLSEVIAVFETVAPPAYQEPYDNAGLATGNGDLEVTAALLCIDVTEDIIGEALLVGANLIISHHPVLFHALKSITGKNQTERILIAALSHNIALYCVHTNLDNIYGGVNQKICQKLDLQHLKILAPLTDGLRKLVTYVPLAHASGVRQALFDAGAGSIGAYDSCSFSTEGRGSFRAPEGTNPYAGEIGKLHYEEETRIETVFPVVLKSRVVEALLKAHPYEEVAYDIFPLDNSYDRAGSGMIGELREPCEIIGFLNLVKKTFGCQVLRYSPLVRETVKKVAVCGGSGAFLILKAISAGADVFITGEVKYHQFFDAEKHLVIVDTGHYESERFTIEIFYEILMKNLPNFAVHFSSINTSPINYL